MSSTKVEPFFTKHISKKPDEKLYFKQIKKVTMILFLLGLVIGIIFIILFAAVPCGFKTCNSNATCINRPFNAKCKCNSGFQGNGIECDECGLAFPDPSYKYPKLNYTNPKPTFANGKFVVPFSYPASIVIDFYWEGILYSPTNKSRQYFYEYVFQCGGVLINRRTILTSASCVPTTFSFSPSNLKNDTVTFDVQTDDSYPTLNSLYFVHFKIFQYKYNNLFFSYASPYWPTETVYIKEIIIHEGYKTSSLNNDIALIKLFESVTLDQYGQIACIPDYDDLRIEPLYLAYNSSVIALGWKYFSTALSSIWSQFNQNIVYNTDCSNLYTNATDYTQIICTRDYTSNITTSGAIAVSCNGINGGPIYTKKLINGVEKLVVIGVSINATQCGLNIYANLFNFIDWINENSYY